MYLWKEKNKTFDGKKVGYCVKNVKNDLCCENITKNPENVYIVTNKTMFIDGMNEKNKK